MQENCLNLGDEMKYDFWEYWEKLKTVSDLHGKSKQFAKGARKGYSRPNAC